MGNTLNDLQKLTGLVLDADLMALRRIAQEEAALEAQRQELKNRAEAAVAVMLDGSITDLATAAARLDVYRRWLMTRINQVNGELATLRVAREQARATAKLSFGRNDALNKARARWAAEAAQMARRARGQIS